MHTAMRIGQPPTEMLLDRRRLRLPRPLVDVHGRAHGAVHDLHTVHACTQPPRGGRERGMSIWGGGSFLA